MSQLVEHVVVRQAHGSHEHVGIDLAGFIDPNMQKIVLIGLELQPGTPIRDNAGVVGTPPVLVHFIFEIDAGTAHDLIHDHALGTIDDEGASLGHQRQLTDEDFLLFDLACLFVDQAAGHIHLRGEGRIATLGLFHVVPWTLESVLAADEMQLKFAGVIGDRREALKLLDQAEIQKPLETCPLYLNQVGEVGSGLGDLNRAAAHAGTGREDERDTTWASLLAPTRHHQATSAADCGSFREPAVPQLSSEISSQIS